MSVLIGILILIVLGGSAVALAKNANRSLKTGGTSSGGKGLGGAKSRSGKAGTAGRGSSGGRASVGKSGRAGGGGTKTARRGGSTVGRGGRSKPSWTLKAWNASGAPKTSETTLGGAAAVLAGKAAGAGARGTAWAARKLRGINWRGTRGGGGMTCTKCGGAIPSGEKYVALNRHIETLNGNTVTVKDAEDLAIYHERCEPKTGSTTPDSKPQPAATPPPVFVHPTKKSSKGEPVTFKVPGQEGIPTRLQVPPTLAPHLTHIHDFDPENDAELLTFLSQEVTGMMGYAEAANVVFDQCVTGKGLDPAAMQGLQDYADAFTEAAEVVGRAHKQFLAVYEAIIEAAANGTQMPYNGRFFSGEAA